MSDETITIRVRTEGGEEMDRTLTIVRRMKGISVVDAEHGDRFGVDMTTAIAAMCRDAEWTLLPSESRVDRALRLHAAYVAARAALLDTTTAFTDAEWREYIERQGR